MTDTWVPAPPPVPGPPPVNFPLADDWNIVTPCPAGDNMGIVDGVVLTGVPAVIGAVVNNDYVWSITLNDGQNPPNFTIDHYDAGGNLIDHPLEFSGTNGSAQFNDSVTAPNLAITTGNLSIPGVSQLVIPGGPIGSYLGSANPTGTLTWFAPVIPMDAPNDGQPYVRQSLGWTPLSASLSGYLPLTGGNLTGALTLNSTANRFVAGMASGSTTAYRWALQLGNANPETGGNAGSDFSITSFNDAGTAVLGTPLTVTRATGAITVAATPGVVPLTINGAPSTWRSIGASTNGSMRWQMFLANPDAELGSNAGSNIQLNSYTDTGAVLATPLRIARSTGIMTLSQIPSFPGGANGQVLSTNGSGTLSWAAPGIGDAPSNGVTYARQNAAWVPTAGGGGGIPEAPNDGTAYARKSQAWAHLTHTDITDWTATLAPYALTTALGAYLPLTGGVLSGGLGFGSTTAASQGDVTRHLALFGTTYGINVTASLLNLVSNGNVSFCNSTNQQFGLVGTGGINTYNYVEGTTGNVITLQKSRGGSQAAQTPVLLNDFVGQINFQGYSGSAMATVVGLRGRVIEPTPSSTAMGGYFDIIAPPLGQTAGQIVAAFKYGETQFFTAPTSPSNQYLSLGKSGSGQENTIRGCTGNPSTATNLRWLMRLGDATAESGANAGSNFNLAAYSDTGVGLFQAISVARATGVTTFSAIPTHPTPTVGDNSTNSATTNFVAAGYLALAGGTMTGPPRITGAAGTARIAFTGQTAGVTRWNVVLGTGAAESGANAGSDFRIDSYNDAGSALINSPLTITRASGVASFVATPTFPTPAAGNNSTNGATTAFVQAAITAQPMAMNDNKIINGDMRIDQRNNGATGTALAYTCDRWGYAASQASKGTWQRGGPNGAVLAASGFPYYLIFISSSAYASLAADGFQFYQQIEGDMASDFAWGTASAQPVTLSFWAQSSLTGVFSGSLSNYTSTPTRSYPFTFSLPNASTWTKVVITIPGDPTGTWVMSGNSGGISLHFDLGSGATNRGPANAWATANYLGVTGSVSVVGTNGASFAATGVKLEIGNIATPFNRPPLAQSLAACQRYFQQFGPGLIGQGAWSTTTVGVCSVSFPTMRASPTVTFGVNTGFTFGGAAATWSSSAVSPQFASINISTASGTPGVPANLSINAGNFVAFSAEL